jgi:hypothetical protein
MPVSSVTKYQLIFLKDGTDTENKSFQSSDLVPNLIDNRLYGFTIRSQNCIKIMLFSSSHKHFQIHP